MVDNSDLLPYEPIPAIRESLSRRPFSSRTIPIPIPDSKVQVELLIHIYRLIHCLVTSRDGPERETETGFPEEATPSLFQWMEYGF